MTKKTISLILLTAFVLFGFCMPAFAEEEPEWKQELDGKELYWGDSVTVDEYVIKAEDFNEDGLVFISISKDGEELKTGALKGGYDLVYNDEIKVHTVKVDPNYETIEKNGAKFKTGNWDPYAEINVLLRGEPELDIEIETDKDSYDPKSQSDRDITATITLKNTGDAKAKDVEMVIDTGELALRDGKLKHTYSSILKGKSVEPVTLLMDVPEPWDDTDFEINVTVKNCDAWGKQFEETESETFEVKQKWDLIVTKTATEERHMGESVYVSISIRNDGLCSINGIELTDSVIPGFELLEDIELEKTLSLKAGESAPNVFKYTLIPEKPGGYTLPKAVANFTLPDGNEREISSEDSEKTTIYGPYIVLTKSLDRQQLERGDKLTVTLTAKNTGNVDGSVTVSDTVPPEAKFISGETGFKQILKNGGGSNTVTYVLQMKDKGKVQLPPARASFLDLEDYRGEVYSETPPIVYVGIPMELEANSGSEQEKPQTGSEQEKKTAASSPAVEQPTPAETPAEPEEDEDAPGFGFVPAVLTFLGISGLRKKGRL